jgi:hypothetical protein
MCSSVVVHHESLGAGWTANANGWKIAPAGESGVRQSGLCSSVMAHHESPGACWTAEKAWGQSVVLLRIAPGAHVVLLGHGHAEECLRGTHPALVWILGALASPPCAHYPVRGTFS